MRAPIVDVLCLLVLLTSVLASKPQGLFITPNNVRYLASYIHTSATIEERSIRFGTGNNYDLLLKVPLVPPGEFVAHSSIRITVGLDSTSATAGSSDHDPLFGITDGTNFNEFVLVDVGNYNGAPCYPTGGGHENKLVNERRVPSQATFLFTPFYKYGVCSTAHDGGYTNVGTFGQQLDLSKEISFTVRRENSGSEQYRFYYFLVEFLP